MKYKTAIILVLYDMQKINQIKTIKNQKKLLFFCQIEFNNKTFILINCFACTCTFLIIFNGLKNYLVQYF